MRDALPFLQRVTRVTIAEACGSDEERAPLGACLDDVASMPKAPSRIKSWVHLRRNAGAKGIQSAAQLLRSRARRNDADLLVTGAYRT